MKNVQYACRRAHVHAGGRGVLADEREASIVWLS